MFLPNSRYADVPVTTEGRTPDGRKVTALKLRRLPRVSGQPVIVRDNTQLDVLALEKYSDATKYWHVADANTELEAKHLLDEPGDTFLAPES